MTDQDNQKCPRCGFVTMDVFNCLACARVKQGKDPLGMDNLVPVDADELAQLRSDLAKLRETIGYLADEVKAARAHRETKGGQQVPFHGDFASAPPSVLNRLDWWLRALGHHTK